jgi:hypothetical protein
VNVDKRAWFVVLFAVSIAKADTSEVTVAAEALFEQAIALMDASNFDAACPKLEESLRLDPAGGTALNLGYCREKQGKPASAYAAYADAASYAVRDGRQEREELARTRMKALEPSLPRVLVAVTDPNPDLVIVLDQVQLRAVAYQSALPIDPGIHSIEARAPGCVSWHDTFNAPAAGVLRTVSIPKLILVPPTGAMPSNELATPKHTGAKIAFASAGGLTAIGAVFGILAATSLASAKRNHCNQIEACDERGNQLKDQANALAWTSNVGFSGALVAAVVGGVLYFTARRPSHTATRATGAFEW